MLSKTGPSIILQREWDAEEGPVDEELAIIEKRLKDLPARLGREHVEIPSDEEQEENQQQNDENENEKLVSDLANIIDLTDDIPDDKPSQSLLPSRNPPVPEDELLTQYNFKGKNIQPGSTVEFEMLENKQYFKASFLYITQIIHTADGIKLRGIPMTRMRHLRGRFPSLRNELGLVLHVDNDDDRPAEVQAATEIHIEKVIRHRYSHFTNADIPWWRAELGVYRTIAEAEQKGVMMCRWRCIFRYKDGRTRRNYMDNAKPTAAPVEFIIEHLNAKDVTKKRFMVNDHHRLFAWRGGRVRGGEYDARNPNGRPVLKLDEVEESELVLIEKKPGQKYTFGDMFCGAGGASTGAQKAGFYVKLGCDNHAGACNTYEKVFPGAELHRKDIFELITEVDTSKPRVDMLHLSPPCQFWSPAHTVVGVNDDANIAVRK